MSLVHAKSTLPSTTVRLGYSVQRTEHARLCNRPPAQAALSPCQLQLLLVVVAAAVALCCVAVLTLGSVREHNVAETGERVSESSIE